MSSSWFPPLSHVTMKATHRYWNELVRTCTVYGLQRHQKSQKIKVFWTKLGSISTRFQQGDMTCKEKIYFVFVLFGKVYILFSTTSYRKLQHSSYVPLYGGSSANLPPAEFFNFIKSVFCTLKVIKLPTKWISEIDIGQECPVPRPNDCKKSIFNLFYTACLSFSYKEW